MPFISFEGIDGSGKSSLLRHLADHLKNKSKPVALTQEPGGSDLGLELRQILLRASGTPPCPEAELLLYEADRAQHVQTKIKPLLNKNYWVLTDRYLDSSLAFQGAGRKISRKSVKWLNSFATQGLLPDLTVLVDCPVRTALQRSKKRGDTDRFENESTAFHEAVRNEFLEIAKLEKKRFFIIDSSQKNTETLFQELLVELKKRKLL